MEKLIFVFPLIFITIILSYYNVYAGQCLEKYLNNHSFGYEDIYDKDVIIRDISLKEESQYYTYVKIKFSIPKEECSITEENTRSFIDHIVNVAYESKEFVSIFTKEFNVSEDILNNSKRYCFTSENVPIDTGTVIIDENSSLGKNYYVDIYYLTYYKMGIDDNKFEHVIYLNQNNKTINIDSRIYSADDVIHQGNNIFILYDNLKNILEKENIYDNFDSIAVNIEDKEYAPFEDVIELLWQDSEIFYDSDNYSATVIAYDQCIGFIVDKKRMFVNGLLEKIDAAPYIQPSSNFVMLPLTAVEKALDGASVDWESGTKTATIIRDNDKISFIAGKNIMIKNGNEESINAAAEIKDNHIFVPLRALAESLGFEVEWDETEKTVVLK